MIRIKYPFSLSGVDPIRRYDNWGVAGLPVCLERGPRVVASTATFHARVRGSFPGVGGMKETEISLLHPLVKLSIMGSLCGREVACSTSNLRSLNFESCVWRSVSSHHPQEVLLVQFSLYVYKSDLMPDSFHFISFFQFVSWNHCSAGQSQTTVTAFIFN